MNRDLTEQFVILQNYYRAQDVVVPWNKFPVTYRTEQSSTNHEIRYVVLL